MSDIDWIAIAEPVARHLWGEPNKSLSTRASLRWGTGGSRKIDLSGEKVGFWHDFETGESGGVLKLVMREQGIDEAGAVTWLEENGFITPRAATEPRQDSRPTAPAPEVPPEDERPPLDAVDDNEKPFPVKGYRYTDGDGNTLYEVIRYNFRRPDGSIVLAKSGNPKKTFKQRRPDGRGGYIYNLGDLSHTIYRRQQVEIAIAEGKTIFLPEGEKDVETLEAWGLIASTNSGGAGNWTPALAALFRDADIVILGDDDEAGRKRVEAVGQSLRGIARRIRAIGEWGGPKDVTDWAGTGSAETFMQIVHSAPDWRPAPPASSMGAVGVHQLHDPMLKHDFLIDGFLDRQGVAMMPGASGSGKTFLVLEAAMCVSLGREFFGMPCKPGVVLYQAGEGKQGVAKRLDGWLQDRGVSPDLAVPFQMLTKRVNLFVDDKDTDAIIAEGRAWAAFYGMPVRLVVLDTFNKAITGANEISGQDMGRVLSRMERISTELDCSVLSPIHKSKEGGMRGHTSLTGDVSNVLNVTELQIRDRNGRIVRTVALDKNKDGEKGKPLRFVLRQVVLGDDDRGKPITTCVVDRPDGDEEEYARQGKLSMNQVIALKALRQAIEDIGETAPAGIRAGASVKLVVKNQHWKDRFKAIFPNFGSDDPEKREAEAKRLLGNAGKVLLAGDYIGVDNERGISWPTGRDDRPKREPKPIEKPKPSPLMTAEDMEVPF